MWSSAAMAFGRGIWWPTRVQLPDRQLGGRRRGGEKQAYPRLRNFVLDLLAEGRRKNIIQVLFEADMGGIKERLTSHRLCTGESITITSYVAKCFVAAIAVDKRMQAYRLGSSRVVVFDEVDLAFLVEREWQGKVLPVFFIVRAADRNAQLLW
jgi:hypothetical protein